MKVALWAENLAHPVASIKEWTDLAEAQIVAAKNQDAGIILFPEYSAAHWLHFVPRALSGPQQLEQLAEFSTQAASHMAVLAERHGLLVVSGTFPVKQSGFNPPLLNRAHVFFPDGRVVTQDKLCLTPFEKDPRDWNLSSGNTFSVFEWRGYRMAVVICLDIELPALSARMAGLDIDLVLVPSMTSKLAGYHRVFSCARARAVELLAAVAVVGCIAGAPGCEQEISGASFFLPSEEQFGHSGILAELPPSYQADGAGPLLLRDVPLNAIRAMRRSGKGEVWTGAWKADGIAVKG